MPEGRLQRTREDYRCPVCGGHLLEGDHSGCGVGLSGEWRIVTDPPRVLFASETRDIQALSAFMDIHDPDEDLWGV